MFAKYANTNQSARTDATIKAISESLSIDGFRRERKLGTVYGISIPCEPDGGIWYNDNNNMVVAFEAKKQGNAGNAIERWYKNYWYLSQIAPMIRFVTFCTGEGSVKGGVVYKLFNNHLQIEGKPADSFNKIHKRGTSFYMNKNGFKGDVIRAAMEEALTK